MYPTLSPATPLLHRGPGEIQLGLDPHEAVVLSGLSAQEIRSLEALDGSQPLEALHGRGTGAGDRFVGLVRALSRRGFVVDARADPPPLDATIAIDGQGPTTDLLAGLLRDVGAIVRHGPEVLDEIDLAHRAGRRSLTGEHIDLVVRVTSGALSPVDARHDGVDCLPVLVRGSTVTVGPFVSDEGPCLLCLDLTRADHDPAWALVLAQAQRFSEPRRRSPITALAASLACSRIVEHLDAAGTGPVERGRTEDPSVSVEMAVAPPRLTRRTWARHPRCHRHGSRAGFADRGAAPTMEG
ncbi:hypothetical protein [Mobilicoccus massiliensis]|uniref:hypothetical protein n=1 Tax=Mobilicoccus massiliensis TaxID=1522310 RepID=UPI00058C002F|nr:hypothetical protein [Mobilicoccus massiliensis]